MRIPLENNERVVGVTPLPVDRSTGKKEVLVAVTDMGRVFHLVWMPLEDRYKLYAPEVVEKREGEMVR